MEYFLTNLVFIGLRSSRKEHITIFIITTEILYPGNQKRHKQSTIICASMQVCHQLALNLLASSRVINPWKSDLMQLIFTGLLQLVKTTCIKLVDKNLDNQCALSQLATCSRLFTVDANASWYWLDDWPYQDAFKSLFLVWQEQVCCK